MKTAICVIIKDEVDYLDEWLDYHLNLGIDEIFLYEDYGSLSHSTITEKYGDRVHLNSIDVLFNSDDPSKNVINTGERTQLQLFDYFPKFYRNKFDWILFIDIDVSVCTFVGYESNTDDLFTSIKVKLLLPIDNIFFLFIVFFPMCPLFVVLKDFDNVFIFLSPVLLFNSTFILGFNRVYIFECVFFNECFVEFDKDLEGL
jgi:hypothetical protein